MSFALLSARQIGQLERILDQQMWALGRDANAPQGNLLVLYGFERRAAIRADVSGSYQLRWEGGDLVLSSLGIQVIEQTTSLFLDRGPFKPTLSLGPTFSQHPFNAQHWALVSVLLQRALRWICSYEHWIGSNTGEAWRVATLAVRSRPPRLGATELPLLAAELVAVLKQSS